MVVGLIVPPTDLVGDHKMVPLLTLLPQLMSALLRKYWNAKENECPLLCY